MRRVPKRLILFTAGVSLLAITPLLYIVVRALDASPPTWLRLWTGQIAPLIGNTLLYCALTMALSALIGVVLAWLVERTDLPGRAIWRWLCALPLAMPAYIGAICYIILLRRGGLLEQLWMWLSGWPQGQMAVPDLYSLAGAVVITSLCVYPYVYLPVAAALRGADRTLEEAARMLGHGGWRILTRVQLPLLLPPLLAGALLVGLYALSDFGTMAMLRYNTFTTAIFNQFAGQVDRASASILSMLLLVLTLPLLFGESLFARRGRQITTSRVARPPRRTALGRWRAPLTALVVFVMMLALGLPLLVLTYLAINGIFAPTEVDRIWSVGESVWIQAAKSLLLAIGAATLAVLLSFAPAYLAVRWPSKRTALLLALIKTPNALPGIIAGLSLIMLFNQFAPAIYGTVLALLLGIAFRLLPQALTTGETALRTVPANLELAARTLGYSRFGAFARVTLPAALPSAVASWALVFITAMKELPTVLLLRPPGFDTLPVRIWAAASESVHTQAAPPALLLLITTLVPLALLFARQSRETVSSSGIAEG